MHRRSKNVSGYVKFPVNNPAWEDTKEGGMFVKLVVIDERKGEQEFAQCSGAYVSDTLSEVLIFDDKRPKPMLPPLDDCSPEEMYEITKACQMAFHDWERYHFPNVFPELHRGWFTRFLFKTFPSGKFGDWLRCRQWKKESDSENYVSRPYLAAMVLGSTGWSGSANGEYWGCRYEDLTDDGKSLYLRIAGLYKGCSLHLLTFLDT